MRPDEEAGNAEREDGDTKADHAHVGGDEDEYPADERDERWNRIEPDPIRAWQVRTGAPEAHHADYDEPLDVEWLCRECHAWEHVGDLEPSQWWFVFGRDIDAGDLEPAGDPGFMIDPAWPQR